MKFVVLGSNSFSGSHFVEELLTKGHKVYGISRSKEPNKIFLPYYWNYNEKLLLRNQKLFKFSQFDINKNLNEILELINEFKPEYIVNFASQGMVAESWLNPTHWYKTNLLSQVAFHDGLKNKKFLKKYIHISTPEVYGDTAGWIKENNNFNPTTPYSVSRAACDMHLLSFYSAYDFPVVFTRAANVFGPGQQLYRIIPRTILAILSGKKLKLDGGGYSKRSFIHISDVVKATLQISEKADSGSCWHISTREAIEIKKLVLLICNISNCDYNDVVENVEERLGKDKNYLLDSSSIRENFGWEDNISLTDGIKDTIMWVKDNYEKIKVMNWTYQHKK